MLVIMSRVKEQMKMKLPHHKLIYSIRRLNAAKMLVTFCFGELHRPQNKIA